MSQLLLAAASYVVSIVNSYPLSVSLAVVALVFRRQIRIFAELAHMYQMGRVSGSAADATVSAQTRTKPGDVALPEKLEIYALTWNVGNAVPPADFAPLLSAALDRKVHLVLVGLQECLYTVQTQQKAVEEAAQNVDKQTAETEHKDHFIQNLQVALGTAYKLARVLEIGEMKLALFARAEVAPAIHNIQVAKEATGLMHVVFNKGGAMLKFSVGDISVGVIASHLAAHEGQCKRRNEDSREILRGSTALSPLRVDILSTCHHVIWMGDLNYRLNMGAEDTTDHGKNFHKVLDWIGAGDWTTLYQHDELQQQIASYAAFSGFKEAAELMTFAPTFKVERQVGTKYNEKRLPAYCDRILWRSMPGVADGLKITALQSLQEISTSDHKPVCAIMELKPAYGFSYNAIIPSGWTIQVSGLSCRNLLAADVNNLSDPYIIFDSPDPLLCRENAKITFRTPYKAKTLNPAFEDSELPVLPLCAPREALSCMTLVMHVFDYDRMNQDDYLGTACVSLGALAKAGKIQCVDEPVILFGASKGTLSATFSLSQ